VARLQENNCNAGATVLHSTMLSTRLLNCCVVLAVVWIVVLAARGC
jgi:hypothetical protein